MLFRAPGTSTPARGLSAHAAFLLRRLISGDLSDKHTGRRSRKPQPLHFQTLENRLVMHSSVGDFDLHALDPIESTGDTTNSDSDGELVLVEGLPLLSSNSGATAKLYLDFDGHFEAQWGTYSNITTPAFSLDSDSSTFSTAEIDAMTEIWKRVAEDFAPFNIDVTTIDPGNFSNGVGMRVSIGGGGGWYGNAGGVAYVNTWTNSIVNTVYVFPNKLAKNTKYIAEASSHEAGHGFGLKHQSKYVDGAKTNEYHPGSGDWAPIMGTSYYKTRTTWHDGTTLSATTYQDDMAMIARSANGFGYRTDDHGGIGSATNLNFAGDTATASGIIEQMSDQDAFFFTTSGGQVDLTVNVAEIGANLDAVLELRSLSGELIATADPSDNYGASISANVTGGDYLLVVRSTGEYGSVGQYTVSATRSMTGVSIAGESSHQVGEVYTLNLLENDPGAQTIDGWTIDWGDGNVETITGNPGSATHVYVGGSSSVNITAIAATSTGTHESNTLTVNVFDPVPVLSISGEASTLEGSTYVLFLTASDTGPAVIGSWTIDWGDGNIETITGNPDSVSHVYADGTASFTIQATATNSAGTFAANDLSLMVNDVAATLAINGSGSVIEGQSYVLNLTSTDPGQDTITSWTIDWGDGTIETINGDPSSVTHVYADGGQYSITATATDEDGSYQSNLISVLVTVDITLEAPSDLTGQLSGSNIELNWTDNSTGETGFVVERAKKPKGKGSPSWEAIATVGANTTSHTDTPGSGEWIYRVRAVADVNSDGQIEVSSSFSNEFRIGVPKKSGGGGGNQGGGKGGGPRRGLVAGLEAEAEMADAVWTDWSAQSPNASHTPTSYWSSAAVSHARTPRELFFAMYDGVND